MHPTPPVCRVAELQSFGIMRLGLKRGDVRLVEHQQYWGSMFVAERDILSSVLCGTALRIEHVGSTAVADLEAKPILDIAIGVRTLEDQAGWPHILALYGYCHMGDRFGWGEHFYAKGPDSMRTVYLHVMPIKSVRWENYLMFRDILRTNADVRREYNDLKRKLALALPDDRNSYTDEKAAFITKALNA
jgi:GrpB-like predicted nucleotidyltransferase (UPF0157 family)